MNSKHPEREALVGFLYEELAPERQQEVRRHLATCAECRAQLASWRSVRGELPAWQLARAHPETASTPPGRSPRREPWRVAKLAAAALFLIGLGFVGARWRMPAPTVDPAALRAAVVQELRADLRTELARFAAAQTSLQEGYQASLTETLRRLEAQRLAEYAGLRKDMETVALRTEDEFQNTRQNLRHLAGLNP